MTIATTDDVQVRFFRPLEDEEVALVAARLGDVETKIRQRIPDLDDRVALDPEYRAVVVTVCCEAVLRLIRNPEGYVQETDGNYTYMLTQDSAANRLTILPEEWADLGISRKVGVVHNLPRLPWSRGVV